MRAMTHLANVRVTGTLTQDADLASGVGHTPHALLILHFEPLQGLPYVARIDLGTDVADHMHAQAELPLLRTGALVSVGGDALEYRNDHGHAVLRLVKPRDAMVFAEPINPTPINHPPKG